MGVLAAPGSRSDSDSGSNSPPAGDADNPSSRVQAQSLEPGKEALGSAPSPSICPPFCLACLASGQQRLSLALCKRGAAASGGIERMRAMCKRQASFGARLRASSQLSVEPRARLCRPRARLHESGARLPKPAYTKQPEPGARLADNGGGGARVGGPLRCGRAARDAQVAEAPRTYCCRRCI
jgi:hypothetical protein